jgi:3-dehydroquinate dehydratase
LIDVRISNIYRPETFRQHFGALLAASVTRVVGQPGCLTAPDALAVLPNDAR